MSSDLDKFLFKFRLPQKSKDETLKDKFIDLKSKELSDEEKLQELFKLYKELPDFDRFPMPEVFYERFGVKKPKPYDTPVVIPHKNFGSEVVPLEIRGPVDGGVREIPLADALPVEVKLIKDDELVCTVTDLSGNSLSRPRADSSSENQHE
jgi:hypothetical protein